MPARVIVLAMPRGDYSGPGGIAIVSNVHGHRPDPTADVELIEVHEDLVQITILTGSQGGRGAVDNAAALPTEG